MLGEAPLAVRFAAQVVERGVYVHGLLVPGGAARAGADPQMSAAHTIGDLDRAIAAFAATGRDPEGDLMRALVKERPEPGLVLTEVPDPVPGEQGAGSG